MIFSTYLGSFFLIIAWGLLIKSVLNLWLNDFFFLFLLGFGLSSIVRARRHTSREVSGIGEISILRSAKKGKIEIQYYLDYEALLGHHWGSFGGTVGAPSGML